MTGQPQRPAPGTRVRYRAWGSTHVGVVQTTPSLRGDDSFTVQDVAPPWGCIQSWPGDPRLLPAEDDE